MLLIDGKGLPLVLDVHSASPAEVRLIEPLLDKHDVPNIVQEVFRVVAAHLDRFLRDRPGDTFRGWLITLTRTEILAYYRRRSKEQGHGEGGTDANVRLQHLPDGMEFDSEGNGSDANLSERQSLVRRSAELIRHDFAPKTWQAFWRSVIDEQDVAQIAADLQMTANAIRQARFRVLQRLREYMQEWSRPLLAGNSAAHGLWSRRVPNHDISCT